MKEEKCNVCGEKLIITFCVGYDYEETADGKIICMECSKAEARNEIDTGEVV